MQQTLVSYFMRFLESVYIEPSEVCHLSWFNINRTWSHSLSTGT
jgi:hypothetical protein